MKIARLLAALVVLITIMFAEYRIIMVNICPYPGEDGTIYLDLFGHTEVYDLDMEE